MSRCSLSLVCILLFVNVYLSVGLSESYDVCVIGGGASGSFSTVLLKQLGYRVKLIERNNTLGGHCRTYDFEGPNGETLWIDMGVVEYTNSTWAAENGFGNWAISSEQFITQFVPRSKLLPLSFSDVNLNVNVNFLNGQLVNLPEVNQTEFEIAFNTLLGIVIQYPWLATGERPDPVPTVLMTPFADFIVENNLQVLVDPLMNGILFSAGVGDLAGMSTLTALTILNGGVMLLLSGQAPDSGFILEGGCHVLYTAIEAYLGDEVLYNANINSVRRSRHTGASVIKGTTKPRIGHGHERFEYHCGKTVVAIYPLLQNLVPWFDLTDTEAGLFCNLEAQGYLALITNFTDGPLVAGQGFGIINLDPTQPYNVPALPNLGSFNRAFPFGPAAAWANSETSHTSAEELLDVSWEQISAIPSSVLSDIKITQWTLHQYMPHWNDRTQQASPSGDTRLKNLQGTHGTYWVGAGTVAEGSAVVWNQAFKLLSANFPPKP